MHAALPQEKLETQIIFWMYVALPARKKSEAEILVNARHFIQEKLWTKILS